jgi:prevent-host-death family protein
VKDFTTNQGPLVFTQNGEAKMVVMDIAEYERQQETLALLNLVR